MLFLGNNSVRLKENPLRAHVGDEDSKPVLCTPIIYNDGENCGIGVIVEWDRVLQWGLCEPRDYIASWRAGEILRAFGLITQNTVRGAFYAASRSLKSKEEQCYTSLVIEGIGSEKYNNIMSLPIPREVVRTILDDRKIKGLKPSLYPLTEEIEAGTLVWRDEFSEAGVLTPEAHRAKKERCEEMMLETNNHLYSMTNIIGAERMSMGKHEIRNILVMLFEKKANEKYPVYILVAMAVIMSGAAVAHMDSFASLKMFKKVCQWVSRTSRYPRLNLFGVMPKKEGALSPEESSNLLHELTNQYFPVEKDLMGL